MYNQDEAVMSRVEGANAIVGALQTLLQAVVEVLWQLNCGVGMMLEQMAGQLAEPKDKCENLPKPEVNEAP